MRGKDSYIVRLYLDIGMVPSDLGIFRSTGELWEFAEEVNGPYWALVERWKKGHEVARASPCPNRIGQGVGARPPDTPPTYL